MEVRPVHGSTAANAVVDDTAPWRGGRGWPLRGGGVPLGNGGGPSVVVPFPHLAPVGSGRHARPPTVETVVRVRPSRDFRTL